MAPDSINKPFADLAKLVGEVPATQPAPRSGANPAKQSRAARNRPTPDGGESALASSARSENGELAQDNRHESSDEMADEALWAASVEDCARTVAEGRVRSAPHDPRSQRGTARLSSQTFDVVDDSPVSSSPSVQATANGVDARVLRDIRRDSFPIEARLDLHGATLSEALEQVEGFICACRRRGCRRVLVIYGRGNHSEDGRGVLRPAVLRWLAHRLGKDVLAYAGAAPSRGGAGAVCILLRR